MNTRAGDRPGLGVIIAIIMMVIMATNIYTMYLTLF